MDKMNNTSKQAISEKTLTVITAIQAVMLAAYGMFALLLHHRMMSYDLYSVGNAGSPVHFCYVVTMLTGAFLIIYRLIKDRKSEGFLKSQGFLVPLAVTGTAFIFKQANTVYTSTEGGSLFGLIGYLFSAGLSGSDPIDEFVYGRMTILKYLFVMGIGAVCAALTIVRLLENNNRRISLESINSEAIRTKANAAAAAGSDYINKASRMASAAAEAVKQAAGEDGSSKDINVDDSADNLIINDGVDASAKKSDRAKNVVIGVLIAALIAGGAAVYSEFFAFTKYELSDFTTGVFVEGYSGEAAALEPSINYEMLYDLDYEDALHLEEVLETVEYRITPNEDLSNGDKIRIEATYNEEYAKAYKIKLTGLDREEEVTDAIERMRAEDISKDVLARAIEIGESKVIDEVIEEMEGTNINCKHIAALFLSPEDTNGYDDAYDDELMMVFKTTYDYDSGEDIRHYTEYYVVEAEYLTANEIDNVEDWNMLVDSLYFGDDVEDIVDIDKMRSDLAEIGYEVTLLK